MSSEKITAPFSAMQVAALNRYQTTGNMHPFTCGNEALHQDQGHVILIATTGGWICPVERCDYTQNWAHAFMATY